MKNIKFGLCIAVCATAALAHDGVKDPQVMARMQVMSDISAQTKRLAGYAKGQTTFDAAQVRAIGLQLSAHADASEALFKPPAKDPKSEAKDAIWSDWAGFLRANQKMREAAVAVSGSQTLPELDRAFRELGHSCTACHKTFRLAK
ncbi:MAG: cytochrome c [Pseudomonadota bacterium]